jgi:hypothetical protein
MLCDKTSPSERLVQDNTVPTSQQAHCSAKFESFLDYPHLRRRNSTLMVLDQSDNLDVIRRAGIMDTTSHLLCARPYPVSSGAVSTWQSYGTYVNLSNETFSR